MAEKSSRGFAAMDRAKQRQIASKGGKAAHQKGTAHEFTSEEAAAAGRKGGRAAHQKGTAHEFTREEASAAGRKGGHAAHQRNASRPARTDENQARSQNGHQGAAIEELRPMEPSMSERSGEQLSPQAISASPEALMPRTPAEASTEFEVRDS